MGSERLLRDDARQLFTVSARTAMLPVHTLRIQLRFMQATTITIRQETLYAAYAPEFDMVAWGGCSDEAVNNLMSEVESTLNPSHVR